ncbi:MAG: CDP-glycerol glycerophosphotransferase family protein [Actinomycetes bacterium]
MQLPHDTTIAGAAARRGIRAVRWRVQKVRSAVVIRLAGDKLATQMVASRVPINAEVVLYFAEGPDRAYQLDQWIPVFEKLAERHSVVVVLRDISTMKDFEPRTSLPVVCVSTFLDLMSLYDLGDFKVGVYVNNGMRNFQSLNNPRMLHVHVNHGESDKLSSFSNQVKAYDRVFVAGPVAMDRYREALIDFDDRKLVMTGRPQLDLTFAPELGTSSRRTVMYAPTWEGESESNNWTSLDKFGLKIVKAALAQPDARVVYKPHPRVAGSRHRGVARAHKAIVRAIEAANASDPDAGHLVSEEGNILAMFDRVDLLVGDVSSVTLDFLYLRPGCPIFLTDRRNDRGLLEADTPLAAGADVIDDSTIATLPELLAARLSDDARAEDRARTRARYFGDAQTGESSERFLAAVEDLISYRDKLLVGHRRVTTGDVDAHG